MNVIYYACSRSDGILNNVRLFDDMSKQEQDEFKTRVNSNISKSGRI